MDCGEEEERLGGMLSDVCGILGLEEAAHAFFLEDGVSLPSWMGGWCGSGGSLDAASLFERSRRALTSPVFTAAKV